MPNLIDGLSKMLDYVPVVFRGNPLNLVFLDDANRIRDPETYSRSISNYGLIDEKREYIVGSDLSESIYVSFPIFYIDERPDPYELSERMFWKFHNLPEYLITQDDIAEIIVNQAQRNSSEVVVLILVDGLSYYDLLESNDIQPCLVNGPSITEFGFPSIISRPSISNRFFALGYTNQLAYSFYDLGNPLSSDLHSGFSEHNFHRIHEFNDVIRSLKNIRKPKTYIQVILDGLDSLCHSHHDSPPVEIYKNRIMDQLNQIEDVFAKKRLRYQIHLISDHGILWRENYKDYEIVDDLFIEDKNHPRYVKGTFFREYGIQSRSMSGQVTLYKAPYLNRKWRNNEWGVHGGVSAWESIVPFITRIG